MQKSHISQLGASSAHGKHSACDLILPRPWWCTSLGNVRFLHWHGFLLHYLMTIVRISVERWGGGENCPIPSDSILMSYGILARTPPIEKSPNSQLANCWVTRNHLVWDIMVPRARQLPHWELCDFSTCMSPWCISWSSPVAYTWSACHSQIL